MPAIDERWSAKLLPTIWPFSSATMPEKPGVASSIETKPVATSTDGKSRAKLWSSASFWNAR
jgi:anti-sigma-K factor RskA